MKRSLLLLSYQLHPLYITTSGISKADEIIFIDSDDQWTYYKFHKQRIVYHLSAMHHAIASLKQSGYRVRLLQTKSLLEALQTLGEVIAFKPTNRYELKWLQTHQSINLLEDPTFFISEKEWYTLLPAGKPWKLDPLYRQFRQRFAVLMEGDKPIGGQYSFDAENRGSPPPLWTVDPPRLFLPDATTQAIMQSVEKRFVDHPGELTTFAYPVTRLDALTMMHDFFTSRIDTFGVYQDAMMVNEPWMSHSLLSAAMNLGLLSAKEVIEAAMKTYQTKPHTLASIEGFIRQILGWREYVRGVYLVQDDAYLSLNTFNHQQDLPKFYYDGETKMQCLQSTIQQTLTYGYNHHIQRLMILSNYANLVEVEPLQVNRWFNEMYIDSFEWIVAANVIGMGMHADGGKMSTKPYISSGAYIDKMSNYCQDCAYVVTLKTGAKACPFNSLYWQFIHKNKSDFSKNPRMAMMVKVLDKMDPNQREAILKQAKAIIHASR